MTDQELADNIEESYRDYTRAENKGDLEMAAYYLALYNKYRIDSFVKHFLK